MPCSNQIKYFTLRAEITCRQTMHIDNHDRGSDSIVLLIFSAKHIFGSVRTFPFLRRRSTRSTYILGDPEVTANIYCKLRNLPKTDTQKYSTDLR